MASNLAVIASNLNLLNRPLQRFLSLLHGARKLVEPNGQDLFARWREYTRKTLQNPGKRKPGSNMQHLSTRLIIVICEILMGVT